MELKYLFEAEFEDGTIFKQNKKDVSTLDPKRSAFYDLLQDKRKIVRFTLTEQSGDKQISIDLTDGKFNQENCTGADLLFEGDASLPEGISDYRLIFYRQHKHELNPETTEELSHQVRYCLGWQTTFKKKNYQQVLGVN